MDRIKCWIWLQQALGYGNKKIKIINELYENIEDFYFGGESEWRLSGVLNFKDIESLKNTDLNEVDKIINSCKNLNYEIIDINNEKYPKLLYEIDNPPAVIYSSGNIDFLKDSLSIAVVGTRKASEYGIEIAEEISYELALNGFTIVSGGAMGIDSVAHEGAIKAGGKTLPVLGCGLNFPYLSSRAQLRKRISETGAVISEYPPSVPAYKYNFPIRNRIISGLCVGTIVVEAGLKSGSLITANLANDQNRDVYIVPPKVENFGNSGSIALIGDGAKVISGAKEIIFEYSGNSEIRKSYSFNSVSKAKKEYEFINNSELAPGNRNIYNEECYKKRKDSKSNLKNLDSLEKQVYNLIVENKIHVDDIVMRTNIPSFRLLVILTNLELEGLIRSLPGKYYEAT